ncbi:7-carboxy-7-deazaguanine synthase QueE [Peribacillus cavernae]|uniref:7-carboxy-7-deazaguanine synthase n=1 Tax=Peribacillus cavernae TaxID=1674310 RepID=A0A433HRP6_9BACI|nr:7-carboxy-7-deazaguanine synthase QueE [Peribacillus cavernae]MDQ0218809.1 7-carboxy-7-deazaguanine synthase [Peribacillus cavernae]RUQ31017.1 7-carboxy-7-deazaguanine synthase QueE [Peribacillus cavernae]
MSRIPVMEIFGPTIQGEGMVIGQKTMFVRTAGCDYSCAWCDSAFTWDGTGKQDIIQMEAEEIWEELKRLGGSGFSFVTISGGNPALLKNLSGLIDLLQKNNIKVCLETQGSKWQDWFLRINELTISPKPPSSKMKTDFVMLDSILEKLKNREPDNSVSMKIVVFDDDDFQYAKKVYLRYPNTPFFLQVGNDDSKTNNDQELIGRLLNKYEWLIEKVMADNELTNIKVLPQLHTYIWGNKRGV